MSDAQLYISGVNFIFNPHRLIFNKVVKTRLVNVDGTTEKLEDNKLYRVVANLYSAQMLSVVGDKSYGLMSVVPKTADGTPITDFEAQIIYNTENKKSELKEWYAVVEYLASFDQENGVSVIPEIYSQPQGRKIVEDNYNIVAILSKPNHIALAVYGILLGLVLLIADTAVSIIRRKKRRKNIHKVSNQ
jgi:hypothetical protein